jgi:4-hydroxy-tetrahydrodipicolinate synthase
VTDRVVNPEGAEATPGRAKVRTAMLRGCYTALVTPVREDGSVDYPGIEKLVEFQIVNGIQGVLVAGTTGESPTLPWEEHNEVTERVCKQAKGRCYSIAGSGSNSTREALNGTEHAAHVGADAVLLVDPYYNGPSSLEIRREYIAPVAREFPDLEVIPYIIPGRTGTKLQPEDLALLAAEFANVRSVKEATGDLENMARTRRLCGDGFAILSGDDDKTEAMMRSPEIKSSGVISVMSNVIPGPLQRLTELLASGSEPEATRLSTALAPMFGIVGVTTTEQTKFGPVACKARNPLPVKTLMNILGMPAGPCRAPLGRMTRAGFETVLEAARETHRRDPRTFAPVAEFFGVDIDERLSDNRLASRLTYSEY